MIAKSHKDKTKIQPLAKEHNGEEIWLTTATKDKHEGIRFNK